MNGAINIAVDGKVVVLQVAGEYNLDPGDVIGQRRFAEVVEARGKVYLRLQELGYGASVIGRWIGRSHTTVLRGIRKAEKREGNQR